MEKLHIQPSELDRLPYFEFEYIVSIYNDILKDRKNNESTTYETERDKYNMNSLSRSANTQLSGAKLPKMPSIKLPKI